MSAARLDSSLGRVATAGHSHRALRPDGLDAQECLFIEEPSGLVPASCASRPPCWRTPGLWLAEASWPRRPPAGRQATRLPPRRATCGRQDSGASSIRDGAPRPASASSRPPAPRARRHAGCAPVPPSSGAGSAAHRHPAGSSSFSEENAERRRRREQFARSVLGTRFRHRPRASVRFFKPHKMETFLLRELWTLGRRESRKLPDGTSS